MRPANKNVPKIKHRKKIKVRFQRVVTIELKSWLNGMKQVTNCVQSLQNKAERERDRLERLNDREVLGPPSNANRIPRSKCGLNQDVFSKMDEGEDKGTQQSPVKSIEITSILNGLQGSNTH